LQRQPKNFLFPPVFADDEQTRTAYLLHFILWMLVCAVTIMELMDIIILQANILRWLSIIIIVNAVSFLLMFLSWKGHTRFASSVLMIGMTMMLTILAITGGGIRTPSFIMSSGIVFATGLLLGKRAGIFMAIALCLIGFGLVAADRLTLLPRSDVHHTSLSIWINIILNLIFIACLQYLSMRTINRLLRQVREELADRKVAEKALRQNEEKYRQLFEIESDALFLIEQDSGRILDVNSSALSMYGYSREELLLLSSTDLSAEPGTSRDASPQHPSPILSALHRKKNGTVFPVQLTVSHFDYQGQKVYLSAVRDITEQKRAEEERRRLDSQIQQTQKLESLGVLAGGIAHDFNNMLMVAMGNADLALQDLSEFSPARPMIAEIIKTSNRASELCKQMLTYSGKSSSILKTMNLSEAVEEMGRMIEFSISKKAVLQYHLAENLPSIKADATQVSQIILNLIINASEALGEKEGAISVTTAVSECDRAYLLKEQLQNELPEGFYVYLEVADTGCGMDHSTLEKIFDPFFSTKFTGRGLGLSTVLGIVRQHGGALKVDSEPGKGSTFKIFFPAAFVPVDAIVTKKARKEGWKGSGVMLLVEDEDSIRRLCRRMLERIGFEVLAASDGRQALELFRQHHDRIKCVLLDLTMPHMDGGETFYELRRIKPDLPVVMSSGFSGQKVAKQFIENGLSGFIQKPYHLSDLTAVLKKVLANGQPT
jgi:PAS domain S-box-containing protein